MTINKLVTSFIQKSIRLGDLNPLDSVYVTNKLLTLLRKEDYIKTKGCLNSSRLDLLDEIVEYAISEKIIEDLASARDIFSAQVMDLVTPRPSEVNKLFWEKYEESPLKATDWFFQMSRQNNYIKTREIAQNIEFTYLDERFGEIQMAINLSKPEKDPREIALATNIKRTTVYPSNALVVENEGYAGHLTHPGRTNHRIIRIDLNGDKWGFQYSPYAYYNEHSIFLAIDHRPMDVGPQAIKNLLEIVRQLPHYFVGSNAGLPIVGGSILSHDHYQGGRHHFPIQEAKSIYSFTIDGFEKIEASLLDWPMSTIRLRAADAQALSQAAERIMSEWKEYSDETVGIYAYTDETPHNAITPIARKNEEKYELDIVLRNNRTSKEFPDGIFHPHPKNQHIKKENIGLIEVMGLAILPPRLKAELAEVEAFLLGTQEKVAAIHQEWANKLKESTKKITDENVKQIIQEGVGKVFIDVLHDAGVFKANEEGRKAFIQFIERTLI